MTDNSYDIGDYFAAFIEHLVHQGRYATHGDVVRAGLRLLEEREVHLELFRKAIADGVTSGMATPFDIDAFIETKRAARQSSS